VLLLLSHSRPFSADGCLVFLIASSPVISAFNLGESRKGNKRANASLQAFPAAANLNGLMVLRRRAGREEKIVSET